MSIEDVTFFCNGCGKREVVIYSRSGSNQDYDSLISLPKGWENRFGSNGRQHLHRCPGCVLNDKKGT